MAGAPLGQASSRLSQQTYEGYPFASSSRDIWHRTNGVQNVVNMQSLHMSPCNNNNKTRRSLFSTRSTCKVAMAELMHPCLTPLQNTAYFVSFVTFSPMLPVSSSRENLFQPIRPLYVELFHVDLSIHNFVARFFHCMFATRCHIDCF
jgi:hypothetical protein